MEQYAMYLRKSRVDRDIETENELETLSRHQTILTAVAEKQGLSVGKIYKEVVSGETIGARPVMQQLLHDVEQGIWKGVLVMEIERLARGDSIDQGIVAQTFKYSNTLIVTPSKTYDPNNEFDEEYLEFGLFMSRREYKTINRRLQIGRHQAVKEGKFGSGFAPIGYRKVKLKGGGYTLEIVPEEAKIIRMIFDWYVNGENGKHMGLQAIAIRLHEMGVKTATGITTWRPATIKNLIDNPVYAGKIKWQFYPERKVMVDGEIVKKRDKKVEYEIYDGLHEAIIDEKTFNAARERREKNRKETCPRSLKCKNPLKSLVVCGECGGFMTRRPDKSKPYDRFECVNPHCHNKSTHLDLMENAVIEALKTIVSNYEIKQQEGKVEVHNVDVYLKELQLYQKRIEELKKQLEKIYDAYETGVYNSDMFLSRSERVKKEIEKAEKTIKVKKADIEKIQSIQEKQKQFIPKIKNVIEVYYTLTNADDKNKLLKEIIEKIVYIKEKKTTRWTNDAADFKITVYPKLLGDFL